MPVLPCRTVFTCDDPRVLRDKDVPGLLLDTDLPNSFGLVGSDTFTELDARVRSQLSSTELNIATQGVRFALLSTPQRLASTRFKMRQGHRISVATSYPQTVEVINKRFKCNIVVDTLCGGQSEKLPRLLPRLDGVIDIVETGASFRKQDLIIAADNLLPVSLTALWRR
jgi:ATP phosphoribosyltransferase